MATDVKFVHYATLWMCTCDAVFNLSFSFNSCIKFYISMFVHFCAIVYTGEYALTGLSCRGYITFPVCVPVQRRVLV